MTGENDPRGQCPQKILISLNLNIYFNLKGTVKLSKLVSQSTIFLDFRQQEVFE
ncbi:hypothetical protein [Rickettsia sp. MEAM1 (Bemisia tabaci)]|uniref:hypothetical protein n=1 Tax=Rickettsia sp. MEAM1 (Bemisia tabaci) TaxID=1182263 RepID=UPI0012ECC180|nr:hypothetical protein [Rickettsia sp. MEAM1 (Bemisia tabaci)]